MYLAEHHQSRGLVGGSPPFKIAYGKCICPFPNCPHLLEWGARQPAGTALVYVHNIVCSLHICAVSCVSVVRIYKMYRQLQTNGAQTIEHSADGSTDLCVSGTEYFFLFYFKDL